MTRCQNCAIARQCNADGLTETIHTVGCEHSAARAASRAGILLDLQQFGIGNLSIDFSGSTGKGGDEIERLAVCATSGFHGAAAHEDGRNVAPHGCHQHAGRDFIAVGNTDHSVEAMGFEHGFDGVGNDFPTGEGVFHSVVSHGDTVANTDGVENERNAASLPDAFLNELGNIIEMHMSRHDVHMGTDDGDEGFAEIFFIDAAGAEQTSVRCPGGALFDGVG